MEGGAADRARRQRPEVSCQKSEAMPSPRPLSTTNGKRRCPQRGLNAGSLIPYRSSLILHRSPLPALRTTPPAYAPILPKLTARGAFVTCDTAGTYGTHHGYAPRTATCAAVPGEPHAMSSRRQ
jgi:hypothetical protein